MLHRLSEGDKQALSFMRPPEYEDSDRISYLYCMRTVLIQDNDGIIQTMDKLIQQKNAIEEVRTVLKDGKRLSDTIILCWKQPEQIELRAIEKLLRRLSDSVIPQTQVFIKPDENPRFRAALQMKLGTNPMPAATAGVLYQRPNNKSLAASAMIYLEPWAQAYSGWEIELESFNPPEKQQGS